MNEKRNLQTGAMDGLLIGRLVDRNNSEAHLSELFQDSNDAVGGKVVNHDEASFTENIENSATRTKK